MTAALPKPDQTSSRAIADWNGEDAAFAAGEPLEAPYKTAREGWSFAQKPQTAPRRERPHQFDHD